MGFGECRVCCLLCLKGVELEFRDGVGWNGESYENKGV
jgi:hypothetical protein